MELVEAVAIERSKEQCGGERSGPQGAGDLGLWAAPLSPNMVETPLLSPDPLAQLLGCDVFSALEAYGSPEVHPCPHLFLLVQEVYTRLCQSLPRPTEKSHLVSSRSSSIIYKVPSHRAEIWKWGISGEEFLKITLLQMAEEGLELLVLAGTEKPTAPTPKAPVPQFHLGVNPMGKVLGFTHRGWGWIGWGQDDLSSGITYTTAWWCYLLMNFA